MRGDEKKEEKKAEAPKAEEKKVEAPKAEEKKDEKKPEAKEEKKEEKKDEKVQGGKNAEVDVKMPVEGAKADKDAKVTDVKG